ncbi:MAG: hypothetical protein ACJAY1_001872, partial [Glaciecola sp.]
SAIIRKRVTFLNSIKSTIKFYKLSLADSTAAELIQTLFGYAAHKALAF